MKFLDYSRASVAETLSHCYVAFDQNYLIEDELESIKNQAKTVWKKVNNFITYLNKSVKKEAITNKTDVTNSTNRTNETNVTN